MELREPRVKYLARSRYKQTEVGLIPEDWEATSLSAVSKTPMQNGLFFKPSLKGFGVKLINVGDLFTRSPIDLDSLELFGATEKEVERFRVDFGDLFFTRSSIVPSGIAHCNIYSSSKPESVVFDSHVIRFRPATNKVVPSYLFRFCVGTVARRYLVSNAKTGTMTTIDQGVLGKCPVLLPPKAEQRAIAEALSDADALIESLDQLIAKKRDLKQGAMQELLTGKLRLPGFSGDWKAVEFGDIATIRNTKVISSSTSAGTQCVELESIGQADGRLLGSFDASGSSSKYSFQRGDVLFGRLRAYLRKYWLAHFDGICSTEIWPLIPRDERLYAGFLHLLVQTNGFVDAASVSYGTHMPRSDWSVLSKFAVQLPAYPEQTAIATILSDMDTELAELQSRLTKARQIKQGMMQELLTGRIRLL